MRRGSDNFYRVRPTGQGICSTVFGRLSSTTSFIILAVLGIGARPVAADPLIVDAETVVLCGENSYDYVEVINGGAIQASSSCEALTISSDSYVLVDSTSRIWDEDSANITHIALTALGDITVGGEVTTYMSALSATAGTINIASAGNVSIAGTLRSHATWDIVYVTGGAITIYGDGDVTISGTIHSWGAASGTWYGRGGVIDITAEGDLDIPGGSISSEGTGGGRTAGHIYLKGYNIYTSGSAVPALIASDSHAQSSRWIEFLATNELHINGSIDLIDSPSTVRLMGGSLVDTTNSTINIYGGWAGTPGISAGRTPGGTAYVGLLNPGVVNLGDIYGYGGSHADCNQGLGCPFAEPGLDGGSLSVYAPLGSIQAHGVLDFHGGAALGGEAYKRTGGNGGALTFEADSVDHSNGTFNVNGGYGWSGGDGGTIDIAYCSDYVDVGAAYLLNAGGKPWESTGIPGDPGVLDVTTFCHTDCNGNDVADMDDIANGTSLDCNGNSVPDECDIAAGASEDCNDNNVPDECEPDADGDGVPDDCDLCPGFDDSIDTDGDSVPDSCDPCPLDNPDDSDGDGVCDTDDVCPGFDDNIDTDGDGVPDGCDAEVPLVAPYPHGRRKNRYISIDPNKAGNDGKNVAFKIELQQITLGSCSGNGDPCRVDRGAEDCRGCSVSGIPCLSAPMDCAPVPPQTCDPTGETCVNDAPNAGGTNVGRIWWVGPESPLANSVHLLVSEAFRKVSTNWPNPTHVSDCEIVPKAVYGVTAVVATADPSDTEAESRELAVETTLHAQISSSWWADCVGPIKKFCGGDIRTPECIDDGDCTAPDTCDRAWTLPDGSVNFDDVNAALALVAPGPTSVAPDATWVDLHGNATGTPGSQNFDPPNFVLNFSDIGQILSGFGGFPYKGYDPADCPDSDVWP